MPRVAASSSILMHLKTVNWRHGSAESCMVFGDTNLSPGPISICGAHMPQSGASWRGSECTHHWPRGYAASTVRQRYLCRERHPERPTGQGHSSNLGTAEAGCEVKPILLTGGAGFIGSNFILQCRWPNEPPSSISTS